MGFSMLDYSWSFRLKLSPLRTPKLVSSLTERDPICLKMRFGHSIRAYNPARALKCRSVLSDGFVERRNSPCEVISAFNLSERLLKFSMYLIFLFTISLISSLANKLHSIGERVRLFFICIGFCKSLRELETERSTNNTMKGFSKVT